MVVYGAAISACEQDGSWVEALQLMDSTSVFIVRFRSRYRLEGNIGIDSRLGVTQNSGFNILNQAGSRFAQSLQCNLQQ